ncbi:MAG: ABC transporter permease [Bacillota bacterium]
MREIAGGQRKSIKQIIVDSRTFIILILICIIFACLKDTFYNPINIINIVKRSAYIAVVAFTTTLCLTQGNLDISVGGTAAMVGTFVALAFKSGLSLPVVILIGLASGALAGWIVGFISIKGKCETFLVSMAMKYVYVGIAYWITAGTPIPISNKTFNNIFGTGEIFGFFPLPIFIVIASFMAVWFLYKKTKYGYYLRAIGSNIEAAQVAGINTDRIKIYTFVLNGALGGVAGMCLAGMFEFGSPAVASELALEAIAAVVLGGSSVSGGKGNVGGTVIGVLIIGVINNGLQLMGAAYAMESIVKGAIIIIAILLDSWARSRES